MKDIDFNYLSHRHNFLSQTGPIYQMPQDFNKAYIIFNWLRKSSNLVLIILLLNATYWVIDPSFS